MKLYCESCHVLHELGNLDSKVLIYKLQAMAAATAVTEVPGVGIIEPVIPCLHEVLLDEDYDEWAQERVALEVGARRVERYGPP